MKSRDNAISFVDIFNINQHEENSFLLFNVLSSHLGAHISADQTHAFADSQIKLSHSLKRVVPESGSVYFEVGDDEGRLYQLALGFCYYERAHLPENQCHPIALSVLNKNRDYLTKLESELYKPEPAFPSLIGLDFKNIASDIFQIRLDDHQAKVKLAQRIAFYTLKMQEAAKWAATFFKKEGFSEEPPSALLTNFMLTAGKINYFPKDYVYPFQRKRIQFYNTIVRRKGRYEFLARTPFEYGSASSIYHIVGLFPPKPPKEKQRAARICKVSTTQNLELECRRTQEMAPYLHAKYGGHSYFSERYAGDDLITHYNRNIKPYKLDKATMPLYILEVLRIAHLAFDGLAKIMGDRFHGDIKLENLLMSPQGEVLLIDFESKKVFTALYAAPERFNHGVLSAKTDVFSLIRSLVVLWGDRHPIWQLHDASNPNNETNIRKYILKNDIPTLLAKFKAYLQTWKDEGYITFAEFSDMYALFASAHRFDPDDRPSAHELAGQFKTLHDLYIKNHMIEPVNENEASQARMKAGL